jgi:hypothetical protein
VKEVGGAVDVHVVPERALHAQLAGKLRALLHGAQRAAEVSAQPAHFAEVEMRAQRVVRARLVGRRLQAHAQALLALLEAAVGCERESAHGTRVQDLARAPGLEGKPRRFLGTLAGLAPALEAQERQRLLGHQSRPLAGIGHRLQAQGVLEVLERDLAACRVQPAELLVQRRCPGRISRLVEGGERRLAGAHRSAVVARVAERVDEVGGKVGAVQRRARGRLIEAVPEVRGGAEVVRGRGVGARPLRVEPGQDRSQERLRSRSGGAPV